MNALEWFQSIAYALNDAEPGREFRRYPVAEMIKAYNAAICLVADYRPDLFTELRIVKLETGKHQDHRSCCANVLDVLDQVTQTGDLIKEIVGAREKPGIAKRNWKKPSCLRKKADDAGIRYLIDSVSIDPNLNGRFTVDPPVPCGVDAFVIVKCVNKPCAFSISNLNGEFEHDCTHVTAAWHYVLARMLTGDRFANAAGGDAAYHYKMFYDLLGISQRQEAQIESQQEAH